MGILRIVCLLVFSLLLSLGNASAAGVDGRARSYSFG